MVIWSKKMLNRMSIHKSSLYVVRILMPFSLLSCANYLQRAVVLQAAQQAEKHLMGMEGVKFVDQMWEFP